MAQELIPAALGQRFSEWGPVFVFAQNTVIQVPTILRYFTKKR